jgi:hypothetical protein
MAIFEVSGRTTIQTASAMAVLAAVRGSTTRPTFVREIHLFGITAPTTSGAVGLCKSTALGTGTLTSTAPVARDLSYVSIGAGAVLITAWGTAAPTTGAVATVFRRWSQSPAIGNGIIWTFDGENLEIPLGGVATGDLCLVNLQATAPGTFDITAILEE